MAAPWIKMRADLRNDPAVVSIARACRLDVDAVVGKLHAVWSWADGVTDDGLVDGVDASLVDEIARRRGFAAAMAATPRSRWLVIRDGAVEFPRFDRHNGKSAKRRAADAERKRLGRDEESAERPPDVREQSASEADKKRTREEKRREEKRREEKRREEKEQPPDTPQGGTDSEASPETDETDRKPYAPKHPMTAVLCESIDAGRKHWRDDIKPLARSRASLRAMDGLLLNDRREPEVVVELLEWLFGGETYDYKPERPERFDWRSAIKSGAALRRNWDALVNQRRAEQEAAHARP